MFKGSCFVVIGLQSWDVDIGSNCKNLAIELSKNNKVLYVNTPIYRKSLFKLNRDKSERKRVSVLRGENPQIEKVSDSLWSFYPKTIYESINWIGLNSLFDVLNRRIILIESLDEACIQIMQSLGYRFYEYEDSKESFVKCPPRYNTFCLHPFEHKHLIK